MKKNLKFLFFLKSWFFPTLCVMMHQVRHTAQNENVNLVNFYKFLEFTEFLRILKILMNFKNKIRYREKLQIGRKSLTQTY